MLVEGVLWTPTCLALIAASWRPASSIVCLSEEPSAP